MNKPRLLKFAAAALLAMQGSVAWAETQAGISAAVRGSIDLTPITSGDKHQAVGSEDIFLGDAISSYDEAGMQLILLDETVFTIGANTDLTVDQFVYDPATGTGEVAASLAKGVFRFVTGNIAQGDPEDMKITLPTGVIGIRGTIGAVSYVDGVATIVLLGPGPDNNANAREGHLEVTAQGVTINLTRPGYGTTIEVGQPPTTPALFSEAQIGVILNALAPPPALPKPMDAPTAGTATLLSNQDMAEAETTSGLFLPPPDPPDDKNAFNATASNSTFGIPTFDQLRSIQTGFGIYKGVGTFTQTLKLGNPVSIKGLLDVTLKIDFGTQTFCPPGPGGCQIIVDTSLVGGDINASTGIIPIPYPNSVGFVSNIFKNDFGKLELGRLTNPNFRFKGTSVGFLNTNGIIANQAFVSVEFKNAGKAGFGSLTTKPRR